MRWVYCIIGCWCLLTLSSAHAQGLRAYFSFDAETTFIGTPLELTITVESPVAVEINVWPDLSDSDWLQVLEADDPQETMLNDQFVYSQTMQVMFWQVGNYLTPEVVVETGNGPVNVQSDFITIQSLINTTAGDLQPRPSRTPVDLPVIPRWQWPLLVAAFVVVVLAILRFVQIGRTQLRDLVRGTPAQLAIAQLDDLKLQAQVPEIVYPAVVNEVRHYIQQQFRIAANEMTTSELMQSLRENAPFDKSAIQSLQHMLEQADLVKFANLTPERIDHTQFINFAIRWIRSVDRQKVSHDA